MTSPNRPPSCDLLKPKLKECPFCAGKNVEIPRGFTWVICRNSDCNSEGPINDPQGHKWNSIPRRAEVAELLRLVDEVTGWEWDLINTSAFPEDGKQMCEDLDKMEVYTDKLRKEWNL